jgi:hypothetical protein
MADFQERPNTAVIEKSSGGGMLVISLVLVAIIAIAAYFLVTNDNRKTNAIDGAATHVSEAAQSVGDAATTATQDAK